MVGAFPYALGDFLNIEVINDDCLSALRWMPDNSVDAIVTDPPYGLSNTGSVKVAEAVAQWTAGDRGFVPVGRGYMGQKWDGFVPPPAVWDECLRVLKPGGHLAAFAGSRTQHLMGMSISLSGLEVRDTLAWIQGGGFPRSLDYGKQLAKLGQDELSETYWDWRSEMKPANEPIVIARKPLGESSIAKNIARHGTGAMNIGDTRYGDFQAETSVAMGRAIFHGCHGLDHLKGLAEKGAKTPDGSDARLTLERFETRHQRIAGTPPPKPGRWPANVVVDEDVAGQLGSSAKYFYCPRISKKDIPKAYADDGSLIQHQTVKPLALMEWLCTLITPPGGTILDPFAGSGTTLEAARNTGFNAIGIEREADYVELINKRLGNNDEH